MATLADFLRDLTEHGRVRISCAPAPAPARVAADPAGEVEETIRALDAAARLDMPLEPPPLQLTAATWAATLLYDACRLFVNRELPREAVDEAFSKPCPEVPLSAVCYSVDLTLRYLPGMISLTRGLAEDDPLVAKLIETAKAWPLSSVGVAGIDVGEIDISPFIHDPSLRQLYVDRIIETGDAPCLNDPLVRETAAATIGAFPSLAPPNIVKALQPENV